MPNIPTMKDPSANGNNAAAVTSNDVMKYLMDLLDDNDNGNTPTTTNAPVEKSNKAAQEIKEIPFMTSSHNDDVNGPCSNDNPDYYLYTQPCPDALTVFDGIGPNSFDSETSTTTSTAITSSSTSTTSVATTEVPASIVDTTNAPVTSSASVTNINATASNDILDLTDGDGATPGSGSDSNDFIDVTSGATVAAEVADSTSATNAAAPAVDVIDKDTVNGDSTTASAGSDIEKTYPSFYSCTAASEEELMNNDSNEKLPFTFNYEIYTAPNSDVEAVLETFEEQLANGVASSLGLVECGPTEVAIEVAMRSSSAGGGVRRRTLQRATPWGEEHRKLNVESLVVGVSMDPVDELDTEIAECTSSAALGTPSTCSPIVGAMTAWIPISAQTRHLRSLALDATTKAEQEAMLRDTVQSYIEQNANSYLTDDLLHVAYVDRSSTLPTTDELNDGNKDNPTQIVDINAPQESRVNYGMIGLGIALALLAIVAVGAAVTYRRRNRRRRALAEEGAHLDLENHGAFPALTPESESMKHNRYGDDEHDTQDALPPSSVEEDRYNSLFGLTGAQKSDDEVHEDDPPAPSVLAALGVASTIVTRQLSYNEPLSPPPPPNSPENEQDVSQDTDNSYDIAPMTPMADEKNNYSDSDSDSYVSAADPTEDYGGGDDIMAQQRPASPALSTGPSMDDSTGLDNTMPRDNTVSRRSDVDANGDDDDDDESEHSSEIV